MITDCPIDLGSSFSNNKTFIGKRLVFQTAMFYPSHSMSFHLSFLSPNLVLFLDFFFSFGVLFSYPPRPINFFIGILSFCKFFLSLLTYGANTIPHPYPRKQMFLNCERGTSCCKDILGSILGVYLHCHGGFNRF